MTLDGLIVALAIFGLRVLNYAISTVRLVAITRQQRMLSSLLAFIEALIFAVVIAKVVTDLDTNVLNLFAYCAGASVGSYLGIMLEARFVTSYRTVNVITQNKGHDIALAIRDRGYGVTETIGEGRDGAVTMLRCVVTQRDVSRILDTVRGVHADAFVSVEEARAVQRGWLGAERNQK
jgi:uncharacterized protein YebE (UPF0316 family)